jgi:hypothetical protein
MFRALPKLRGALIVLTTMSSGLQPFELGGDIRLIRSAVKYWKHGKFWREKNLMIQSHERSIKPFSAA